MVIDKESAIYLDIDNDNYHKANILGVAIYNDKEQLYVPYEYMGDFEKLLKTTGLKIMHFADSAVVCKYNHKKSDISVHTGFYPAFSTDAAQSQARWQWPREVRGCRRES